MPDPRTAHNPDSPPLRILTIGGSGFMSGAVARAALAQGHRVWTITRGQRPLPPEVTALTADRHDMEAMQAVISDADLQWDLVVDCIGYEAADARQDIELFRDRARQLVFISTDFVFSPQHRRFPQPEDGSYLEDGYGGGKRHCELEFLNGDCGAMQWTVVRPCHIYGPGSQLGCLPLHGRDPELIARMRAGEALKLVGGGHFLQQPIFVRDLAELILSVAGNPDVDRGIFNTAGPDIVESRQYYEIIAGVLGVPLTVEKVPVGEYSAAHPEHASFLCHRIYDLSRLRDSGSKVPSTPITDGLREHVESMING